MVRRAALDLTRLPEIGLAVVLKFCWKKGAGYGQETLHTRSGHHHASLSRGTAEPGCQDGRCLP